MGALPPPSLVFFFFMFRSMGLPPFFFSVFSTSYPPDPLFFFNIRFKVRFCRRTDTTFWFIFNSLCTTYDTFYYFCFMIRKELEMIRFSQGLSKSELCLRSGVSRSTYSRFIRGEDISLSTLEKLFSVLGVVVKLGVVDGL